MTGRPIPPPPSRREPDGFGWDEPSIISRNQRPRTEKPNDWDGDLWDDPALLEPIERERALAVALESKSTPVAVLRCGGRDGLTLARVVATELGLVAVDRRVEPDEQRVEADGEFVLVDPGGGEWHPKILEAGKPLAVWCERHGLWSADLDLDQIRTRREVFLDPPPDRLTKS